LYWEVFPKLDTESCRPIKATDANAKSCRPWGRVSLLASVPQGIVAEITGSDRANPADYA